MSSISEPIPIPMISGRYLLFDIDVVTYLRRTHNICGTFIGSIPQVPQQNQFMGLPVELMPEEAKLLVANEVAYIIDDAAWHTERFQTYQGLDKERYLQSLRSIGLKARREAQDEACKRSREALGKIAARKAREAKDFGSSERTSLPDDIPGDGSSSAAESLFGDERPGKPAAILGSSEPYAITPTTSYASSSLPQSPASQPSPASTPSSALFAHLHNLGYFIMPGLRFGCDFNVYPGDPLRFHSHFLATSYGFHQDIPMITLVGGGRLGTGVKKGFLIGGPESNDRDGEENVRTFCIEWASM